MRVLDGATLAERRRFEVPRYVTTRASSRQRTERSSGLAPTAWSASTRPVAKSSGATSTLPRRVSSRGSSKQSAPCSAPTSIGRLVERDFATGLVIRTLDAQNGNAGSLWSAHDGTELVSFGNNEPVVSRWRLDGTGPITPLVGRPDTTSSTLSPDGTTRCSPSRAPAPGADPPEFNDDNVVDRSRHRAWLEPTARPHRAHVGGQRHDHRREASPTAGLQVVHYELGNRRRVIADGVVFDYVPEIDVAAIPAAPKACWCFPTTAGGATLWPLGIGRRPATRTDDSRRRVMSWAAISPTGDRIVVGRPPEGVVVFDGDSGAELGRISNPDIARCLHHRSRPALRRPRSAENST